MGMYLCNDFKQKYAERCKNGNNNAARRSCICNIIGDFVDAGRVDVHFKSGDTINQAEIEDFDPTTGCVTIAQANELIFTDCDSIERIDQNVTP